MTTARGLCWTQHRKQRIFLKDSGIDVESEKKQRTVQKERNQMWNSKNWEEIAVNFEWWHAWNTISIYWKHSWLCQISVGPVWPKQQTHNGTIPSNEIWIKVGGDHGGGSFSLLVGWLVFWAKSTTKGYIMAKNNVQSVFYLLCTQVTKPQIIHKPQNQSWHKLT